jgi:cytosine/adenosine deaminase-related metal-dependent hydrolase
MILNNVTLPGTDAPVQIVIEHGLIKSILPAFTLSHGQQINFSDAMIFPGLINAHDHLDFNLFPKFGVKTYNNYTEWGVHIHQEYKNGIAAILKIPAALRVRWGIYKNLLGGVTTVVNHGAKIESKGDLINVFEGTQVLHSVHLEKGWQWKLNNPFKARLPVTIHTGEGKDWLAFDEINRLTRWNLLKKKLIGIHAVAMTEEQAKKFSAVVWCPQSNYFLLNQTASVNKLQPFTSILFGTDSTLTSDWDIWAHLRFAKKLNRLDDVGLYETINEMPSKVFGLNRGAILPGKEADIVVADIKQKKADLNAFYAITPADLLLVMHAGEIRMFDACLLAQNAAVDLTGFSKIYLNERCKYVQGYLPGLMDEIRAYCPTVNFPVSAVKKTVI